MTRSCSSIISNVDFTLEKYKKLCQAVASSNYTSVTLAEYLQTKSANMGKQFLILRHDIDRTPQRTLGMAETEYEHNLKATYYFRTLKGIFNTDIMDTVSSYGHEIGFHYETLDKCKGDIERAGDLFKKELTQFRKRYNIQTTCGHGNPLTRHDNKDIWKSLQFEDLGLLGEAFLSLDYNKFAYFSDSGRTWLKAKSQKMPGKDDVLTAFDYVQAKSTDDVIGIIKKGELPNICILTHCERWCGDITGFSTRYIFDLACSWSKSGIYALSRADRKP
jgi:hypothetical protein